MASKKSNAREKIKLVLKETGEYYTTMKNKKNTTEKLRLKKYSAKLRKHVEFVEDKIK